MDKAYLWVEEKLKLIQTESENKTLIINNAFLSLTSSVGKMEAFTGPCVIALLVSSSLDCTVGTWDDGDDDKEDGR